MLPFSSRSCCNAEGSPRVARVDCSALATPCGSQHGPGQLSPKPGSQALMYAPSHHNPHGPSCPRHRAAPHVANRTASTLCETIQVPRLDPSMQLGKGRSPASARLCGQRAAQQVLRILAVQAAAAHAAAMCRRGRHTVAQVRLPTRPPAFGASAKLRRESSASASSQGVAQNTHIRVKGLMAERAGAGRCQAQQGQRSNSSLALVSAAGQRRQAPPCSAARGPARWCRSAPHALAAWSPSSPAPRCYATAAAPGPAAAP